MFKINQIKTAKGRDGIEINSFRYRKDKVLVTGDISWRCTNSKCPASLKTNKTLTSIKSKPTDHNHDPPDINIPSSPSVSEPPTPTSPSPTPSTPTAEAAADPTTPSLTQLLSPYVTLTPEPPQFTQLDKENDFLRRKVAELNYTNSALTDRLIEVEKQLLKCNEILTPAPVDKLETTLLEMENTEINKQTSNETNKIINPNPLQSPTKNPETPIKLTENTKKQEFNLLTGINVLEADMGDIIDLLKHNKNLAFSHTISKDFENARHMSAGVAVVFKNKFGKPKKKDCLTESLAYQEFEGAAVYSLVTKPVYYEKPTKQEYDTAFEDFKKDFTRKGFTTLVCSPMGCVRDQIRLEHFAENIVRFQKATGANVLIVTKDQKAGRKLRRGLDQFTFMKQLRKTIKSAEQAQPTTENGGKARKADHKEEKQKDPPMTEADWYRLSDEELQLYMSKVTVPDNVKLLDVIVSHMLKINQDQSDTDKMRRSLALDTYDYVLATVNDREKEEKEGGTHWSLLLYTRENHTYYHLDSVEPLNRPHAQRLAVNLSGDPDVSVIQLQCRQQDGGVECGAYAVHFAEVICSMVLRSIRIHGGRYFSQNFQINKIYEKIRKLKKIQNLKPQLATKSKPVSNAENSKTFKNVTMLSDSHGRGLGRLLQNQLSGKCKVYSVVKPNGKLEHVASDLDYEASKLKNNDHLVVLSGTNNVSLKNNFNVKNYVKEIAEKTNHTNVILCTIPQRYDEPNLNSLIRKVNIELIIEALKYDHVKLVSLANTPRSHYTSQGLHLNNWGKQNLCKQIADKIKDLSLN